MNIFNNFDNTIESVKTRALLIYHPLRNFTILFRYLEPFLLLLCLSYLSTFLPSAVTVVCQHFRTLGLIIVKPVSVFVFSNFIIVLLVFKSGNDKFPASDGYGDAVYVDFVKKFDEQTESTSKNDQSPISSETDEIVYHDKQIISESAITNTNNSNSNSKPNTSAGNDEDELVMIISKCETEMNIFRRNRSERMLPRHEQGGKKPVGILQRSETEKCRKVTVTGEGEEEKRRGGELFGVFDELSNEEFNRTIEAFIKKQVTFHRQERFALVPHPNRN